MGLCRSNYEFIELIARLTKDQECAACGSGNEENADCSDHELFDMPNDDAVETLHGLISGARRVTGIKDWHEF